MRKSFNVFTYIAIFITCLGLIGLTSFILEQKREEISIRKILGASYQSIIVILAKEFVKCIAIAALIAYPIGYFIIDRWLQNFAYRISLSVWILLISRLAVLEIALLTVSLSFQQNSHGRPGRFVTV